MTCREPSSVSPPMFGSNNRRTAYIPSVNGGSCLGPGEPPMRNFGFREITECIRSMIADLHRLLFPTLSGFCIPRVGLHFLNCFFSCLPTKANQFLVQHHRRDPYSVVDVVIGVHVPDSSLRHLRLERRGCGIDNDLGVIGRADKFG